jgi:hypothetical protein
MTAQCTGGPMHQSAGDAYATCACFRLGYDSELPVSVGPTDRTPNQAAVVTYGIAPTSYTSASASPLSNRSSLWRSA